MKRTTILLLIFYIFSISSVPCCYEENCPGESNTEQTSKSDQHEKEDTNKNCTQFFNCGSCSGFTISYTNISRMYQSPTDLSSPYLYYTPNDFIARIWQPPI